MNKVKRAIEVLNKELDFQLNRLIRQCEKRIDFIQSVLDILNEDDK